MLPSLYKDSIKVSLLENKVLNKSITLFFCLTLVETINDNNSTLLPYLRYSLKSITTFYPKDVLFIS
jgi:catabolite regulation protein CreA